MTSLFKPETLDAVLSDIWARLVRGGADRRSAFHTPVVASIDAEGTPQQRVMVLRKTDEAARTMRFHTDIRSAKADQIGADAPISVLGYDAAAKIQIRVSGRGCINDTGAQADAAWAASSPSSRRCYLATPGPGTLAAIATSGLPKSFENRVPERAETEAGRPNFAVLIVEIEALEWLYLAADGHRRARFLRSSDSWQGGWLIP